LRPTVSAIFLKQVAQHADTRTLQTAGKRDAITRHRPVCARWILGIMASNGLQDDRAIFH
jgi:hypothetical protein